MKRGFELFPGGLEGRVKAERRKEHIEEPQRETLAAAQAALNAHPGDDASAVGKKKLAELKNRAPLASREAQKKREEKEARQAAKARGPKARILKM